MSYQCVKCGKEIISVNQEERAHDPAILRAGIGKILDMQQRIDDPVAVICLQLLAGKWAQKGAER